MSSRVHELWFWEYKSACLGVLELHEVWKSGISFLKLNTYSWLHQLYVSNLREQRQITHFTLYRLPLAANKLPLAALKMAPSTKSIHKTGNPTYLRLHRRTATGGGSPVKKRCIFVVSGKGVICNFLVVIIVVVVGLHLGSEAVGTIQVAIAILVCPKGKLVYLKSLSLCISYYSLTNAKYIY